MPLNAYISKQTVWAADAQNPPPNFIELASGKMLFACSPGTSHLSTDARLAIKTATSEAAANAGTFSAETVIEPYVTATGSVNPPRGTYTNTGMYFGGGAYFTQVKEGPNAGRVWMMYTSGIDLPLHDRAWNNWQVWLRYTDNPDDSVITWSSRIEMTNLWDGGYGIQDNIKGFGPLTPMLEVPGTNGQEFVLVSLGFDSTEKYEYSKLLGTTTGPDGTWSVRSVVQTPGGASATYSPSEPVQGIIHDSRGNAKLAIGVNYWPNAVYWKTSTDWGYTWEQGTGAGTTIASTATGPPAFVECQDGSIVCIYRKLGGVEPMWARRSLDDGATWSDAWELDGTGRMRYGNWQVLKSGRIGLCYGIETTVMSSTEASIYWRTFTTPGLTGTQHGAGRARAKNSRLR